MDEEERGGSRSLVRKQIWRRCSICLRKNHKQRYSQGLCKIHLGKILRIFKYKIPRLVHCDLPASSQPLQPVEETIPQPRKVLLGAPPTPDPTTTPALWRDLIGPPPLPPAPASSHQPPRILPPLTHLMLGWMTNHLEMMISRLIDMLMFFDNLQLFIYILW